MRNEEDQRRSSFSTRVAARLVSGKAGTAECTTNDSHPTRRLCRLCWSGQWKRWDMKNQGYSDEPAISLVWTTTGRHFGIVTANTDETRCGIGEGDATFDPSIRSVTRSRGTYLGEAGEERMHGPRVQFRVSGWKVDTDTLTPLRLPQKTRSKDQVKSKARLHTSGFFFLHLQHHIHIPAQQLSQLLPRSNPLRCMFSNSLCSAHNSFRSVSLSFPPLPAPSCPRICLGPTLSFRLLFGDTNADNQRRQTHRRSRL